MFFFSDKTNVNYNYLENIISNRIHYTKTRDIFIRIIFITSKQQQQKPIGKITIALYNKAARTNVKINKSIKLNAISYFYANQQFLVMFSPAQAMATKSIVILVWIILITSIKQSLTIFCLEYNNIVVSDPPPLYTFGSVGICKFYFMMCAPRRWHRVCCKHNIYTHI